MNNKTKFSVLADAKEKFVALRKIWGIKNKCTITDIAQKSGLPVEYLEGRPANFAGYLDRNPNPRFIAVNGDLPAHEQAWVIAQQIAVWAQQQGFNSLALNRPWKWEMLAAAPAKLKQKIGQMDMEYRAHWLMLFFATGDEFRAFIKSNPKRFWAHTFTDNIIGYHLSKLRVKLWLAKFRRKIATVAFPAS
jgi:hypothetical protein